ncbi:hypothetical protein D5S18_20785 [Nocardia panacis]|uniref:DUF3159 domain-containing protein n=1 Tax=Nocardia panacis TaxID=2340916 RepID=A0A3A4JU94_9NOCA|nr:VC0807 family protein [Nocardia panacis]RJO73626.1 hypothetical protein D5S18_20785 [Nocardia panacis]
MIPQAVSAPSTPAERRAALRRHFARQLLLEVALPLGGYYALRAAGAHPLLALLAPALITVPFLIHGAVRQRRLDMVALCTLTLITLGAVMSLITGDARTLLVRDSWLFGALGAWILLTLWTRRPFMRITAQAIVTAKIGEAGYRQWDARWDTDSRFRHHLRLLTAVWGVTFLVDAVVRIALAYTLPVDSVPLVSTVQWLVVLGGLIFFQNAYVTKHGLKV